jgi:hypothetical protein
MSTFTAQHAERIAEKLRDDLNHDLRSIAGNDGDIAGFHWSRRKVAELSDAEIAAYLSGLRAMAMNFADWLEHSGAIEYERQRDGMSDQAVIRRHGATCSRIDHDIAGAEGECLHRRHPERHAFAGRLRKFNEVIARIRQFRVELAAAYHAGCIWRERWSLKGASDFAYQWQMSGHAEIRQWLSKLEYSTHGLDEQQREAWQRTNAELYSLNRECDRVRHAYSEQLRRESDATFGRFAAPAGERSAA